MIGLRILASCALLLVGWPLQSDLTSQQTKNTLGSVLQPEGVKEAGLVSATRVNLACSSAVQMAAIHGELDHLAGLLDVRVQKRISRELWNELAGVIFFLAPCLCPPSLGWFLIPESIHVELQIGLRRLPMYGFEPALDAFN